MIIRQASSADTPQWLELLEACIGEDYGDAAAYDPDRISGCLDHETGDETWVVESEGRIVASFSILNWFAAESRHILNLGRQLTPPESFQDGAAVLLVKKINELQEQRGGSIITRVLSSDLPSQLLFENLGYQCVGFQPYKHLHKVREGVLFFLKPSYSEIGNPLSLFQSLTGVTDLALSVLNRIHSGIPEVIRDDSSGYPLNYQGLKFEKSDREQLELLKKENPDPSQIIEISGEFPRGLGYLRMLSKDTPVQTYIGRINGKATTGVDLYYDTVDRCLRIVDAYSVNDWCIGALFAWVLETIEKELNPVFIEIDVLINAPRMLKCLENLGFLPVAYFPGFYRRSVESLVDVVKLVKLNLVYSLEHTSLSSHSEEMVSRIHSGFQNQNRSESYLELLRNQPSFAGLHEGELRKLAGCFKQKLYHPGNKVFKAGDPGDMVYIVMRGQVEIRRSESESAIMTVEAGGKYGELAFLEDQVHSVSAIANQACILLELHREDYQHLVFQNPQIGLTVLRNVARAISKGLKKHTGIV